MTNTQQKILDRVTKDFRFRPCPTGADQAKHSDREAVRSVLGTAAIDLVLICPASRELNHALNRLDEAAMWCHASIDRWGEATTGDGA
jgi:hypothetical protein